MKLQKSDWEVLFPVKQFSIGKTVLELKPVALQSLPLLVKHVKGIHKLLVDSNITVENYREHVEKLTLVILNSAPDLLAVMSGLETSDVSKLPIGTATSLLMACIDVNVKDQRDFLKNLLALANKMGELTVITTSILEK